MEKHTGPCIVKINYFEPMQSIQVFIISFVHLHHKPIERLLKTKGILGKSPIRRPFMAHSYNLRKNWSNITENTIKMAMIDVDSIDLLIDLTMSLL